jgi:hypothetical protein
MVYYSPISTITTSLASGYSVCMDTKYIYVVPNITNQNQIVYVYSITNPTVLYGTFTITGAESPWLTMSDGINLTIFYANGQKGQSTSVMLYMNISSMTPPSSSTNGSVNLPGYNSAIYAIAYDLNYYYCLLGFGTFGLVKINSLKTPSNPTSTESCVSFTVSGISNPVYNYSITSDNTNIYVSDKSNIYVVPIQSALLGGTVTPISTLTGYTSYYMLYDSVRTNLLWVTNTTMAYTFTLNNNVLTLVNSYNIPGLGVLDVSGNFLWCNANSESNNTSYIIYEMPIYSITNNNGSSSYRLDSVKNTKTLTFNPQGNLGKNAPPYGIYPINNYVGCFRYNNVQSLNSLLSYYTQGDAIISDVSFF